jgi:hypothetical protein
MSQTYFYSSHTNTLTESYKTENNTCIRKLDFNVCLPSLKKVLAVQGNRQLLNRLRGDIQKKNWKFKNSNFVLRHFSKLFWRFQESKNSNNGSKAISIRKCDDVSLFRWRCLHAKCFSFVFYYNIVLNTKTELETTLQIPFQLLRTCSTLQLW